MAQFAAALIVELLKWALDLKSTSQEGMASGKLEKDLRAKVKRDWALPGLFLLLLAGCTNAVYVPSGSAVRIREGIPDAQVWVRTEEGKIIPSTMTLPAWWYCLPYEETNGK